MATGRASGLDTLQGYFWHATLLGDRSLAHRLQSRALQDRRALAAVLEGMFVVVIGWLCQHRFGPEEVRQFSERVAERINPEHGLSADKVSQLVYHELDGVDDSDVAPAHRVVMQRAAISTAACDLKLTPGGIDRMVSKSEALAEQWGIALTPYRPGLLMRWRFEIAEARWYGPAARDRWSAERMGAFIPWFGPIRS